MHGLERCQQTSWLIVAIHREIAGQVAIGNTLCNRNRLSQRAHDATGEHPGEHDRNHGGKDQRGHNPTETGVVLNGRPLSCLPGLFIVYPLQLVQRGREVIGMLIDRAVDERDSLIMFAPLYLVDDALLQRQVLVEGLLEPLIRGLFFRRRQQLDVLRIALRYLAAQLCQALSSALHDLHVFGDGHAQGERPNTHHRHVELADGHDARQPVLVDLPAFLAHIRHLVQCEQAEEQNQ